MIFQDSLTSLSPRRRAGDTVADPARMAGRSAEQARDAARDRLAQVGLPPAAFDKYPHEFSGGQRQRIAIARALAAEPTCMVAGEPISALDPSAQVGVSRLLVDAARSMGSALLFISHDLSIVRQIADTVHVMYAGKIVEQGPTATVWTQPEHPYTEALIAAAPRVDGQGRIPDDLPGDPPDPSNRPAGCPFRARCPVAMPQCADVDPALQPLPDGRTVACHAVDLTLTTRA